MTVKNFPLEESTIKMVQTMSAKHQKKPEVFLDEFLIKTYMDWKKKGTPKTLL